MVFRGQGNKKFNTAVFPDRSIVAVVIYSFFYFLDHKMQINAGLAPSQPKQGFGSIRKILRPVEAVQLQCGTLLVEQFTYAITFRFKA